MKYRRVLTLVMIGLIMDQLAVSLAQGAVKTLFSMVYTNDVMGEVEPCG